MKTPISLSIFFGLATIGYLAAYTAMTRLDAESAWSRFSILNESGAPGRAVGHGDQAVALRLDDGDDSADVQAMQLALADAHYIAGDPERAVALYHDVLLSPLGSELTAPERMAIKNKMAELYLSLGDPVGAAVLVYEFVDAAGDGAAELFTEDPDSIESTYLQYANRSIRGFTDALPPVIDRELIKGSESDRLAAAERLTALGGYYARLDDGQYAAAGLLAAAYRTRLDVLGADHPDTAQTALLLGPVYEQIGRLSDAEEVYLSAFHAQERVRGANNPELSLYIRLVADVYRRQGRLTEAEALNVHMRNIFRDAFGARRYAPNRERDRRLDINRPVSSDFPLNPDYRPDDLVKASLFSIPLSKDENLEEMMIRAAQIDSETTMPKMLADLIGACRTEEEALTMRSGYRSYQTQKYLYEETDHNGKVAPPGTSEHQTGLTIDIDVNGRLMRSTDRAYQCFEEQAWKYGFILSYPRGNTYLDSPDPYEPWHWRFVGPRTALLYRETGPMGFPQEFLAALPCYEERALAGLFIGPSDQDVCLASVRPDLADANDGISRRGSAG